MTHERLHAPDRRTVIQGMGAALGGLLLSPLPSSSFAQPSTQNYAALTASQRILLDGPIFENVKSYLAFASVVRQNIRGDEAVARFDSAIDQISQLSQQNQIREFGRAISERILVDCLVASQDQRNISLQQLLAPAISRIGMSATIFQQVDAQIAGARRQAANGLMLLQSIQSLQLLPSVPSQVARGFSQENLRQFAGDSGLAGLIAVSMRELSRSNPRAAEIQNALLLTSQSISSLANGISSLRTAGANGAQQFSAIATQLSGAIDALGRATSMNPQTVQKITKGVNVAGAVLSGAAAGAALGPYGAAAGAVVGLLGSLFGGGSDGPDPTLQALSQLDARISQLQRDMAIGFQQLGNSLAALSQQMQDSFTALSNQIQNFQREVAQNFTTVITLVRGVNETLLQTTIDGLGNAARAHEELYRNHKIGGGGYPTNSQSECGIKNDELLNTIRTAGRGFCGPAFVGTKDFASYLTAFSTELAKEPLSERWRLVENFTGGLPRRAPSIRPNVPPGTTSLLLIETETDALAKRLRDDRYGLASDRDGAAIVAGIQEHCYRLLDGFEQSDEKRFIEQQPELGYFVPAARAVCPPPVAPQDLWGLLSTLQEATHEVSDLAVVQSLLNRSLPPFKERLSAHQLLTGQNSLPALLYVRRQLAKAIADEASTVFCNPFMASVDVLRRVLSNKLSAQTPFRPVHSTIRINSFEQARGLIRNYQRASMPLSQSGRTTFPDLSLEQGIVEGEIAKILLNAQIDPRVPVSTRLPEYLSTAALFEINKFATLLPDVMRKIDGRGQTSALTSHLTALRSHCFVLGVVERCIALRLSCLKLVDPAARLPAFEPWLGGFQEYGIIASYALSQPRQNIPNVDPEFATASVITQAMLDPSSGFGFAPMINSPVLPSGSPPEANPYPLNYGCFWGWGAEQFRPDQGSSPALLTALMRPECAFAGENGAVMGAVQTYSELQSTSEILNRQSEFLDIVRRQFPNGIGAQLREQLRGTAN